MPFTIPAPTGALRLLGVITPFGTSSDPTSGALLVLGTRPDADRTLVGVQRDLARDPVTGQPRTAPTPTTQLAGHPAAILATSVTVFDLGAGYSAVAESDHAGAPLTDLASSVRLTTWVPNPLR